MSKDFSKVYKIFYNALSHQMRTPLSIIQNNLSYMEKTKSVSDCDISLKKVSELTSAIKNLSIEVKASNNAINISDLEKLDFFDANPAFLDEAFKEAKIYLDLDAFNKLINYYDIVAKDKFSCANPVVEGLVENGNPILNIVYDSPKVNNMNGANKYGYLSILTKDALGIDVLNAALYDLNSGSFNLHSEFSLNAECLALKIQFLSEGTIDE